MSLAGGGAAPRRLPIPKPVSGTVQYGPPGSTFHPNSPSSGGSLADVIAQAKSVANQQVQAQVQAIQAQQHIATQQAAARAAQINQASQAAAAYLQKTGLAGNLQRQDYQQAVNNTQGLASGFSGQLAHDAQSEADQAQQMLGTVAGNTQQLENKGQPLSQVLYGLGGYIPGNALNVQGLGAVAAARALPAATLGYGQQQGVAALQSGQGQAASLEGQIAQAQAQRPSITSNLVGQFTSAYNTAQSNAANQAVAQSLIDSRSAATKLAVRKVDIAEYRATTQAQYQLQTEKLAVQKLKVQQAYQLGQLTVAQRRVQIQAINDAATRELAQQKLKVQQDYESGQLSLAQKRVQIAAINAQTARINATKASKTSSGGLSQKDITGMVDAGAQGTETASTSTTISGKQGNGTVSKTQSVPVYTGQLTYPEMVAKLEGQNIPRARALKAVLANPTFFTQANELATQIAQAYAVRGDKMPTATAEFRKNGLFPDSIFLPALKKAYGYFAAGNIGVQAATPEGAHVGPFTS